MNKAQLTEELAKRFENNKRAAAHALESVLDTITRQVASGQKVGITGFGTFERIDRPARMVRNPRTGERKRAKKTSVAKFRPGAELKAVVAGEKKLPKLAAAKAAATARKTTKTASTASPSTTAAKKSASRSTTKAATTNAATSKAATSKAAATKSSPATTTSTRSATRKSAPATKATTKKSSTTTAAKKSTTKKSTARKA